MIDDVTFGVADVDRSIRFYDLALAPLGVSRLATFRECARVAGYGDDRPWRWLVGEDATRVKLHVAVAADSRSSVAAFHAAALAAGGRDSGAPRLRPHYGPDYYGAFVFDPDGNNIEAVCRCPE